MPDGKIVMTIAPCFFNLSIAFISVVVLPDCGGAKTLKIYSLSGTRGVYSKAQHPQIHRASGF
tara:strand:- start:177 stop:365 length:189 start_codon:yes stop_codon:yes gene_type:complete